MIDLSEPQRQSPFAIFLLGVRAIRSLGIAQIVVLVLFLVRGASDGRLLFVGTMVIAVFGAVSVLSWWRFTFQLRDGELIVTKGVLRTTRLTVAVDRIQSIAVEQELLHRATGLVKLVIDTAGSSQAEFTIDAVAGPVADELRLQATPANRPADPAAASARDEAADERIVFQHTPRRLAVAALTMSPWAGLAVIVPLVAVLDQVLEPLRDDISAAAPDVDAASLGWSLVPILTAGALALVVVLNLVRVFLADWQLALRVDESTLRRTSGLLSRTSNSTSRARVQVVSTRQNPLQRRVGLLDVDLSNAGAGDLRLIGCRRDEAASTVLLSGLTPIDDVVLERRVHPALVWLRVRNTALASVAFAGVAWFLVGWWSLLALLVIAPVWWATARHVRTHRWTLEPELATSSHVVASSTTQAALRKANTVRVTQSLFERRRGLATVEVATAAGTITVGMIPIDEATVVRDVVLHAAETDRRPWI